MSVLIKGMEMPTNCFLCPLSVLNETRLFCKVTKNEVLRARIDAECPLVPIAPHKRLIDADAFESIKYELPNGQKTFNRGFYSGVQYVQRLIMDAPTIIETEGEDRKDEL